MGGQKEDLVFPPEVNKNWPSTGVHILRMGGLDRCNEQKSISYSSLNLELLMIPNKSTSPASKCRPSCVYSICGREVGKHGSTVGESRVAWIPQSVHSATILITLVGAGSSWEGRWRLRGPIPSTTRLHAHYKVDRPCCIRSDPCILKCEQGQCIDSVLLIKRCLIKSKWKEKNNLLL